MLDLVEIGLEIRLTLNGRSLFHLALLEYSGRIKLYLLGDNLELFRCVFKIMGCSRVARNNRAA